VTAEDKKSIGESRVNVVGPKRVAEKRGPKKVAVRTENCKIGMSEKSVQSEGEQRNI